MTLTLQPTRDVPYAIAFQTGQRVNIVDGVAQKWIWKGGEVGMKTDEIIRKLRYRAEGETSAEETKELLTEAADRLEELDERVAIMEEGKTGKWLKRIILDQIECKCSACGYRDFMFGQEDPYWFNRKYCPNCGAKMEGTEP